jgi:cytochrome c-type biogenesis protein CcmF
MNSTLGNAFILGGLACAAFGAVVGVASGMMQREGGAVWARRAVYGFFTCMLLANLTMVYALVTHDFSVKYVAQVGSRATPLVFTIVSLWSALEGSILFWGIIMASYLLAFCLVHRHEHARYMSLALGTMLGVGVFFAFLIAGPANPFGHIPNPLPDGPGPNPLLQNHILMVIHPPMLYAGYVGMVVPFGVAVAALLRGEISYSWMAPLRRWTLIGWTFLTVGIILGSWWAYAVLGWGGYWAWDPVENASFHPWLTATAFLHSTMVTERRKMLRLWTVSLALATFILTILGTFMTRSGIFNSVHAFTQSDIGPTFLAFIALLLVLSIALLAIRGPILEAEERVQSVLSRETAILGNNLLFAGMTFTILLGTLYPLIAEAVGRGRVSVGEPYFNRMALPIAVAILFLMGVGPVLPWGRADPVRVRRQLLVPGAGAIATVVACLAFGLRGFLPLLTFGLAAFTAVITLRELFVPARVRMSEHGEGALKALVESAARARRRFGGYIVHLGICVVCTAIAASSAYSVHVQGTLAQGKSMAVGGYQVKFVGLSRGKEPHREYVAANIEVTTPSGKIEQSSPRMNYYERSNDPVGTPAVRSAPHEDLYLSLLAYGQQGESATLNTWIFPLVGWIWWSIPILVLGSLIAMWPSGRKRLPAALPQVGDVAVADAQRGAA